MMVAKRGECGRFVRSAFSLIEVLLVVTIMAILAAAVVPTFSTSGDDAKEASLLETLQILRSQIALHKLDHGGLPPLFQSNDLEALYKKTDADGSINEASGEFGPYLVTGMPANPLTGEKHVKGQTYPFGSATGDEGWLYDEATGNIAPNLAGYLDY